MTDFRALCAELLDEFVYHTDWSDAEELKDRARAALADGPAVPEGREPASVTGQPSDEKLLETLDKATATFPPRHPEAEGLNAVEYHLALELRKARAVLTDWGNPAPQPPAEGEVAELVAWLRDQDGWMGTRIIYSRIAELLQRLSPPQPVPVSERPWEREGWCDKRGMCWWLHVGEDGVGDWFQRAPYPSVTSYAFFRMTHCLPAHALPVPGQEVEG